MKPGDLVTIKRSGFFLWSSDNSSFDTNDIIKPLNVGDVGLLIRVTSITDDPAIRCMILISDHYGFVHNDALREMT